MYERYLKIWSSNKGWDRIGSDYCAIQSNLMKYHKLSIVVMKLLRDAKEIS